MINAKYLFTFGLLLFVGVFTAFAPAAIAPRFVQFPAAFTYSALEGTLWNVSVKDAYWQSRSVGDVSFSISPAAIFSGATTGQFLLQKKNTGGSGRATVSETLLLENFEFHDQLRVKLGAVPLVGGVTIVGKHLEWNSRGQCLAVKATLTTDIPAIMLADFRSGIPDTVANLSCANGDLQVSFEQDVGVGRLSGTGNVQGSAVVNLELVLRFSDQAAISDPTTKFIRRLGFRLKQDGWYSEVILQL